MAPKSKYDVKTVLLLLGFFGVTSVGTVVTPVFGWMARPAIESAHAVWLAKVDSIEAIRLANLKEWIKAENEEIRENISDLRETVAEVPAVQEAGKRRKARLKALRDLEIRREAANTLNQKGDLN